MNKRKTIILISTIVVLLIGGYLVYGWYSEKNTSDENYSEAPLEEILETTEDNTVFINMLFNGFKPYSNDGSNYFNLNSLRTDIDNVLEFKNFNGEIYVNNEKVKDYKNYKLPLDSISKDNNIQINFVKEDGEKSEFFIRTLPSTFPEYTTTGESPYEGDYYVTTYSGVSNQYIFKLNTVGDLTFYKETTGSCFNFTKVNANNKIRYCYLEENLNDIAYENIGYRPCDLVVLDENYNLINTIRAKANGILTENMPLENHDYIYLDDNHYIVSVYVAYNEENMPTEVYRGEEPVPVIAAVIQEILDDEVIFQWQSIDHPELYIESEENNNYDTRTIPLLDYCHLNSYTLDPKDDNLVCSFRNLDEILKIDRKTGEILWTLGGKGDDFNLNQETESFSRQHYAKVIGDGSLIFFDNGKEANVSSAVEIGYDENTKTISSFKRYQPIDRYSNSMGSAQLIDRANDVVLICYGSIEDDNPLFYEIDFKNNTELFNFSFKDNLSSYRVQKYK